MQSYYSFLGSPLHLILDDEIAEGYNRAVKAFFDAQSNHLERTGQKWTPSDPLWMETNDKDQDAYNKVSSIINLLVEVNGGGLEIPEEQITDDYLVKL